MSKLSIVAGATSQSVNIFIQNSSSTTGAGLTGFAPAGGALLSGMICYYSFAGANAASVVQALTVPATVGAAFAAGSIVEIDATHMPGVARLDLPNAALATSKGRSVIVMISGGTNVAPCVLEIELTGWDNQDGVRGGMTALPNAAAAASGGLIINGSNSGTVTLAALTVTGAMTYTGNVSMAAGLTITQSTTNGHGISVTGNGTGHGILATSGGGATGNGIQATSASTNGNGLSGTGTGTGNGILCTGGNGTNGDGLHCVGGTGASSGIRGIGGGTSGAGILGTGTAGNANGIEGDGQGGGDGLAVTGGATGRGLHAIGGGTSGAGALFIAQGGNSDGITATHAGSGVDIDGNLLSVTTVTGNVNGSVASVTGAVGSVTGAVGSVTGNVGGNVVGSVASVTAAVTVGTNNDKTGYTLSNAGIDAVLARTLAAESYAANGAVPTLSQMLYQMYAAFTQFAISGTTVTAYKLDGATTAMTYTLDSSSAPTKRTRAT